MTELVCKKANSQKVYELSNAEVETKWLIHIHVTTQKPNLDF